MWPLSGTGPRAMPPTRTEGPNDASVTLLVRTAGLCLLLLGDHKPPAQRELARSPAAAALAGVDVLKVAHHGCTRTYLVEGFRLVPQRVIPDRTDTGALACSQGEGPWRRSLYRSI
ncbi:hypothetical protein GCM10010220_26820 [Streptomyces parvulus]|nr:hypothetical protein GCM10010220_26820 [Streptomyces parvulus]